VLISVNGFTRAFGFDKHNREKLRKRLHAFFMLVGIQEFKAKKLLKDATNRND
jgi:hypothetical protein